MKPHETDSGYRSFFGPFFTLRIPSPWEEVIVENIPSFFDPSGSGALQLIATRKRDATAFVIREEMVQYLGRHGIAFSEESVASYETAGNVQCMACEFVRDGRYWMAQMMVRGDRMLIVQYNSDEAPNASLAREISAVIQSVEFLPEGPEEG